MYDWWKWTMPKAWGMQLVPWPSDTPAERKRNSNGTHRGYWDTWQANLFREEP